MPNEPGAAVDQTKATSHIGSLTQRNSAQIEAAIEARLAALETRLPQARSSGLTTKHIAALCSVLAALVPLTTAINGYFKWRADLAVTEQQQVHAARMDSLKTVLSAELPELERESRLRLLLAMVEPDDPIHRWAQAELERVQQTVEQLKREKETALKEADQWSQKAEVAAAKIEAQDGELPRTDSSAAHAATPTQPAPAATASASAHGKPAHRAQASPPQASTDVQAVRQYLEAKRLSKAAALKATATIKRLAGPNSPESKEIEQRLSAD